MPEIEDLQVTESEFRKYKAIMSKRAQKRLGAGASNPPEDGEKLQSVNRAAIVRAYLATHCVGEDNIKTNREIADALDCRRADVALVTFRIFAAQRIPDCREAKTLPGYSLQKKVLSGGAHGFWLEVGSDA